MILDYGLRRDWSFSILLGLPWRKGPFNKGAGYIGGCTAFLARRCKAPQPWLPPYGAVRPWQLGITRNGNSTPCTSC